MLPTDPLGANGPRLDKFLRFWLKLRNYEMATKFEKMSHLFWQNNFFYSVASKQVGDFFKFLWPSQKSWTLSIYAIMLYIPMLYVREIFGKIKKKNLTKFPLVFEPSLKKVLLVLTKKHI